MKDRDTQEETYKDTQEDMEDTCKAASVNRFERAPLAETTPENSRSGYRDWRVRYEIRRF
ncbi:hypothetical protein Pyn_22209 [Prunus yedoensis var. nudiflora]|uniref:Uncharacterized protein n=1 Tax=Prunus yedoensis var. nudiflora TaxID=2094558 RepID=A0A314ZLR2_PRUYE|nr:hypothetical protein Pyn_22209 [Prunus yedoensis var. nudiflora]